MYMFERQNIPSTHMREQNIKRERTIETATTTAPQHTNIHSLSYIVEREEKKTLYTQDHNKCSKLVVSLSFHRVPW